MVEGMWDWKPDILGAPFEQTTLPLGEDNEGEVVATLVRSLAAPSTWWRRLAGDQRELTDVDVLYVHGWSDYFFQRRLAQFWTDRGANFYALDLRKYGRSLRPGQTPGFITDLTTYDEDIAAALAAMGFKTDRARADRRLVLMGHSTGGLTLSLWAARHAGVASAVVLNSPWLELQITGITRQAVAAFLQLTAKVRPMDVGPQVDLGFYSRAQREVAVADDAYEINLDWRPERTMPVHAGWLNAIVTGQHTVEAGLGIDVPVCVMLSQRTWIGVRWSAEALTSDTVLVVDDIAKASLKLGRSVTIERIDGALHDVFLSNRAARDDAYATLGRWVDHMLRP
ncbi:alpha/beta hydrolase [Microbacterium mitrae]|nr:alpha/beta hydrolase [Microbacterium mitrae]